MDVATSCTFCGSTPCYATSQLDCAHEVGQCDQCADLAAVWSVARLCPLCTPDTTKLDDQQLVHVVGAAKFVATTHRLSMESTLLLLATLPLDRLWAALAKWGFQEVTLQTATDDQLMQELNRRRAAPVPAASKSINLLEQ